jgi:hypothetical protein
MSEKTFAPTLQAMIDRAGTLTPEETKTLGELWKGSEDIQFSPDLAGGIQGGIASYPIIENTALVAAWENALHAAGNAGRVDEIEAAEAAGRAAKRDERHDHDSEYDRDGAEEAIRSAVLAAGVHDLISSDDFDALTAAWRRVLGDIAV